MHFQHDYTLPAFQLSRGHEIHRENYVLSIHDKLPPEPATKATLHTRRTNQVTYSSPARPEWSRDPNNWRIPMAYPPPGYQITTQPYPYHRRYVSYDQGQEQRPYRYASNDQRNNDRRHQEPSDYRVREDYRNRNSMTTHRYRYHHQNRPVRSDRERDNRVRRDSNGPTDTSTPTDNQYRRNSNGPTDHGTTTQKDTLNQLRGDLNGSTTMPTDSIN